MTALFSTFLRCRLSFLLSAGLLFASASAFAQTPTPQYHRVRVQASPAQLSALGIAADHGLRKADLWFEGDFSDRELAAVREAGFRHSVLQADMATFYAARIAADPGFEAGRSFGSEQRLGGDACARIPSDFIVPEAFVPGSMGGYYTMQEVYDQLDSMAVRYPGLVSPRTAFGSQLTHQGRQQFLLKISDNVSVDETDEPNVLYTALLHAREPAGMMSVLFYMNWLLENYGIDERATYLINNTQLYFVPVVNPDGYEINRLSNPGGGGLWRKNARNNGTSTGVDLNRNWPYEWGFDDSGSSPSASSDVYRGPSAGSEPEVANLMELSVERNFRTALNYHSFGELLIYPWGYDFLFTPDHGTFRRGAKSMVADNFYSYGTPYQTVSYAVNGSSDDWFYGEQTLKDKTFSWTPEVGELGFWPPASAIVPMAQENALANLLLAFFATRYAAVTALTPPLAEREGSFRYHIKGYGDMPVDAQVSVESLSPHLELSGKGHSYSSLEAGEEREGEVAYRVHPSTMPGEVLRYALVLSWPGYEQRQTVEMVFGLEQQPFESAWQPWSEQPGGPMLWSDSPERNYTNGAAFEGKLGVFDLTGRSHSQLLLDLRWDFEPNVDYAWFEASADGQIWVALNGVHTRCGVSEQGPAWAHYTGYSDWVAERLDLRAFEGATVHLRLKMESDEALSAAGVDLRNLRLASLTSPLASGNTAQQAAWNLLLYPNPAGDQVSLTLTNGGLPAAVEEGTTVQILDALGRVRHVQPWPAAQEGSAGATQLVLRTQGLSPGLYQVLVLQPNRILAQGLLAVSSN